MKKIALAISLLLAVSILSSCDPNYLPGCEPNSPYADILCVD